MKVKKLKDNVNNHGTISCNGNRGTDTMTNNNTKNYITPFTKSQKKRELGMKEISNVENNYKNKLVHESKIFNNSA